MQYFFFSTWRLVAVHSKSIEEERLSWEEHVTNMHVDWEIARCNREEMERKEAETHTTMLHHLAENLILAWSRDANTTWLAAVMQLWHRHCSFRKQLMRQCAASQAALLRWISGDNYASLQCCFFNWRDHVQAMLAANHDDGEGELGRHCVVYRRGLPVTTTSSRDSFEIATLAFGTEVEILEEAGAPIDGKRRARILADTEQGLIEGWITIQSLDPEYQFIEPITTTEQVQTTRTTRHEDSQHLDAAKTTSATPRTVSTVVPIDGPGTVIDVPHPDNPFHVIQIAVPSHAQVGQKMLVPVPLLSPSSSTSSSPRTGSKQRQLTDRQALRAGMERNRCAQAVELAVRSSERRLHEELMHHCANTWRLHARAATTLTNAEKILQQRCEEQRERLQRQHAQEMAELAAKMQGSRNAVLDNVPRAGSSQLDPEDDAWMEAMQRLVYDLQRENLALHTAVLAHKR